ncbi:hypothetical protein HDU85_004903 [Gaertneriomyces sp. JEL0708]|nr:hypothetical protein HDU85_004903 [Gaertneriomyces sp. JEL0708]
MRGDSSAAAIKSFGAIAVTLRKQGIVLGTVQQLTEEEPQELVATGVLPHAIPYPATIFPTPVKFWDLRSQSSGKSS